MKPLLALICWLHPKGDWEFLECHMFQALELFCLISRTGQAVTPVIPPKGAQRSIQGSPNWMWQFNHLRGEVSILAAGFLPRQI